MSGAVAPQAPQAIHVSLSTHVYLAMNNSSFDIKHIDIIFNFYDNTTRLKIQT
jgi:hypothetical protein